MDSAWEEVEGGGGRGGREERGCCGWWRKNEELVGLLVFCVAPVWWFGSLKVINDEEIFLQSE